MIDRLYEKVGGAPFFPDADMHSLRAKQVMFLIMRLGRTPTFSGPDLTAAHAGARAQGLTDEHFDALLGHFEASLRELDVDADYTREIIARIETTRDAVLGR